LIFVEEGKIDFPAVIIVSGAETNTKMPRLWVCVSGSPSPIANSPIDDEPISPSAVVCVTEFDASMYVPVRTCTGSEPTATATVGGHILALMEIPATGAETVITVVVVAIYFPAVTNAALDVTNTGATGTLTEAPARISGGFAETATAAAAEAVIVALIRTAADADVTATPAHGTVARTPVRTEGTGAVTLTGPTGTATDAPARMTGAAIVVATATASGAKIIASVASADSDAIAT